MAFGKKASSHTTSSGIVEIPNDNQYARP